jgi:hypothetical protein
MQPWIRASDADRERVVEVLQEHAAAGRLSLDEFTTRVDAANHAVTVGDLVPLTADLPVARDQAPSLRLSAALVVGVIVLAALLLVAIVAGIAGGMQMGPRMR